MPSTVQAILVTPNLDRMLSFYQKVFDAKETSRVPDEGPVFYLGLAIGDSDVGLVAEPEADLDAPQRVLISVAVEDCDSVLALVEPSGGTVLGPPNDMPWGQRVAHVHDPDGNKINITQDL